MPRAVKYLLWTLLGLCVLVIAAGFLIGVVYEDEVKADLQAQLNTHLRAPVDVGEMDLTLFGRFPNVSLHLSHVLAREAIEDKVFPDTLLYAEDLYLEFDLLGLLTGEFKVHELHGDNVHFYPGVDELGRPNYLVWKSSDEQNGLAVDLQQLSFNDLRVRYRDVSEQLELKAYADDLELNGRFDGTGDRLHIAGDLLIDHLHHGEQIFLTQTNAQLDAELDLSGKYGTLKVEKASLVANGSPMLVDLWLGKKNDVEHIILQASADALDLEEVASLFPPVGPEMLKKYGVSGKTDVVLNYTGALKDGEKPELSLAVALHNGKMKELNSGAVFKEIEGKAFARLNGSGQLIELELDDVTAIAASGRIAISGSMSGRAPATINGNFQCNVNLADLLRFMRITHLEQIAGQLKMNTNVSGKVKDINAFAMADLGNISITGTSTINNGSAKLKGMRHRVSDLNADLQLAGRDATIRSLTAHLQGSDVALEGTFHDLIPYLIFKDQKMMIEAKFTSPHLDLAQLLVDDPGSAKKNDYELVLPSLIELDLSAKVDELVFNKFKALDVSGEIRLRGQRLFADPVQFNFAAGKVEGKLELDGRKSTGYPLLVKATLDHIDVSQLFREFGEFGQEFITSKNMAGTLHSFVDLRATLSPALQFDMASIHTTADVTIENGQLIEHGPLIEVAKYIRANPLIAPFVNMEELEKKLHQVQFSTFSNRVEIKDRVVHLPKMEIRSSAMNISLAGSHSFDDQLDHHLNFRLSELLSKPAKKEEFGPIVDDGTGSRIYLHMYGPASNLQFRNDREAIAENRNATIKEESRTLKALLKSEVGLFKNDTTLKTTAPTKDPATKPKFKVDWGDEE